MISKFWANNIDLDLKLVRGFVLTYMFYGFIYFLEVDVFLVPLPMVYFFVPLVGLIMFVRSWSYHFSILFVLIPCLVLKDFFVGAYPKVSEVIVFLTIGAWLVWSISLLVGLQNKAKWLATAQMPIVLLLFNLSSIINLLVIFSLLLGATAFLRKFGENDQKVYESRVFLLIQLLCCLFILQVLSEYSV